MPARPRTNPKPAAAPRREYITSGHLAAALLSHLDGGNYSRVDSSIALARTILRRADLNDLMHAKSGIIDGLFTSLTATYAKDKPHRQMLQEILSYGGKDITSTDSAVAFDILVRNTTDAVITGGALTYELLKGGVR